LLSTARKATEQPALEKFRQVHPSIKGVPELLPILRRAAQSKQVDPEVVEVSGSSTPSPSAALNYCGCAKQLETERVCVAMCLHMIMQGALVLLEQLTSEMPASSRGMWVDSFA
jgi:hypothetical protein